MRKPPVSVLFLLLSVAASAAPVPPIEALKDFAPGQWQMKIVGEADSSNQCVADSNLLLTGGRPASDCTFSLISSQPDAAVVTYRCSAGRSGRTEIRRDTNGLFTVMGQGLDGGLPFSARTQWRRTGGC